MTEENKTGTCVKLQLFISHEGKSLGICKGQVDFELMEVEGLRGEQLKEALLICLKDSFDEIQKAKDGFFLDAMNTIISTGKPDALN